MIVPRSRRLKISFALLGVIGVGCASQPKSPEPAKGSTARLEFRLADTQSHRDWRIMPDPTGTELYIGPETELTEDDVLRADTMIGDRGCIIKVTLTPVGAQRLGDLTRANLGKRLAIFIDDRLACAPMILTEADGNEVYITGEFSRPEAEQLAAALTRSP